MTRLEAVKKIKEYVRFHNIEYISGIDNGCVQLIMVYDAFNAPGKCVESCIWFYEDDMEVRVYYSALGAEICRESEHTGDLFRLLNYINASVFLSCSDGALYEPKMLYTPRIYLTEDGCGDITVTTIINYDFYEMAPVETADYLTAYCPRLLEMLAVPIYGLLLGNMTVEESIACIKERILKTEI